MIERFVARFNANRGNLKAKFSASHPENYTDIVKAVVSILGNEIDGDRIHEIDDGDYQGTLLYIIGASGYQPYRYWFTMVSYGSCSGCDTLEGIRNYTNDVPSEEQVNDYLALALHIVQGLKEINDDTT